MNWSTDMNAAPRGKTIQAQRLVTDKNSASGKSLKTVDEYQRDEVILASKCGKVIKSYWIPDENRFAGFQPGEEIDAWFPWPEHPLKESPRKAAEAVAEMPALQTLDNVPCVAAVERPAMVSPQMGLAEDTVEGQPSATVSLTAQHGGVNVGGPERAGVTGGESAATLYLEDVGSGA